MSFYKTTCTKTKAIFTFDRLPSTGTLGLILNTGDIRPQIRSACENILFYDFTGIVGSGSVPFSLQFPNQAYGDIENISTSGSGCGSWMASGGALLFSASGHLLFENMNQIGQYDGEFEDEVVYLTASLGYALRSGTLENLPFYCDTGSIDSGLIVDRIFRTEQRKILRETAFESIFTGVVFDQCWTGEEFF
jgi:hypothetical protein